MAAHLFPSSVWRCVMMRSCTAEQRSSTGQEQSPKAVLMHRTERRVLAKRGQALQVALSLRQIVLRTADQQSFAL